MYVLGSPLPQKAKNALSGLKAMPFFIYCHHEHRARMGGGELEAESAHH